MTTPSPPSEPAPASARPALSQHILPTAGTMLGICTTLIGLVKILEPQTGASPVDEFGGLVGALFLFSALSSYASIRLAGRPVLAQRFERAADLVFLVGLTCLAILSIVFAYELV